MKKLMLATAIALSASTAYSAPTVYDVTSNIGLVQIYVDKYNLVENCPGDVPSALALGGTATDTDDDGRIEASNTTLTGTVCMEAAGVDIRLTFDLQAGTYDRDDPGTTFTDGTVEIEVNTTSMGWILYDTIDASISNIECIADRTGHMSTAFPADDTQITAGLLLNNRFGTAVTTRNLPGQWPGPIVGTVNGAGYNDAVCVTTLLGNRAGLYLDGEVTLTEQP